MLNQHTGRWSMLEGHSPPWMFVLHGEITLGSSIMRRMSTPDLIGIESLNCTIHICQTYASTALAFVTISQNVGAVSMIA